MDNHESNKQEPLDYTEIKKAFKDFHKEFPLSEEECIGLTEKEKSEINPCGTYCGGCDDYGIVCDGCRNRNGKPIWYDLYNKPNPCEHYLCAEKYGHHDCSTCTDLPCAMYFQYPDPHMAEDIKQMWFQLRMTNFNQINPNRQIEILPTFAENLEKYKK